MPVFQSGAAECKEEQGTGFPEGLFIVFVASGFSPTGTEADTGD